MSQHNQQHYQHQYTEAYDNANKTPKVQKVMNATIITGEYFSKQENRNKKSYLTIGKLFIYSNGGMSLKLDAMPIQNQSIQFYEIKSKNQNNQQNQPQQNYNNNNGGGYQG